MKNVLFGIFAHPDDEAFGPSASLYLASSKGTDVHLVLVTDGEAGTNADGYENLGKVRLKEWEESGRRMGVSSQIALHYTDGSLSNNLYHEIAKKIFEFITKTIATYSEPIELELLTFDHDGITGHLDHIAVSYITTHVYLKLHEQDLPSAKLGKLKYYCLPKSIARSASNHWLYEACGKPLNDIDEVVDYSDVIEKKLHIMQAHYSQRHDMQQVLLKLSDKANPACTCDHFRYYKGT